MPSQLLMDSFKFDVHDLRANREGRLTEKQVANLGRLDKARHFWMLVAGRAPALVAMTGPVVAIVALVASRDVWLFVVFGLVFGIGWPLV